MKNLVVVLFLFIFFMFYGVVLESGDVIFVCVFVDDVYGYYYVKVL